MLFIKLVVGGLWNHPEFLDLNGRFRMTPSQVELRSVNGAPVMDHGTTGACSFLSLSKRFPLCSLIYEAFAQQHHMHGLGLCCDCEPIWAAPFEVQVLVSLFKKNPLQIIHNLYCNTEPDPKCIINDYYAFVLQLEFACAETGAV